MENNCAFWPLFLIFLEVSNLLWPFSTHRFFLLYFPLLTKVCRFSFLTCKDKILITSFNNFYLTFKENFKKPSCSCYCRNWYHVQSYSRECVRAGAAGSRTRRSLGHHLLNPLILRLLVLCAPAVLRSRALQDAPAPADPNS